MNEAAVSASPPDSYKRRGPLRGKPMCHKLFKNAFQSRSRDHAVQLERSWVCLCRRRSAKASFFSVCEADFPIKFLFFSVTLFVSVRRNSESKMNYFPPFMATGHTVSAFAWQQVPRRDAGAVPVPLPGS